MQVGSAGCTRFPRVYRNDVRALLLSPCKIRHKRRLALCNIRPCKQDAFCPFNIRQLIRQTTIDAESLIARRRSCRHAEPSIVIDIFAAQSNASEFPKQVGGFIRQ
ncbi:hypothetical protein D3C85_1601400 [compost metagenome]